MPKKLHLLNDETTAFTSDLMDKLEKVFRFPSRGDAANLLRRLSQRLAKKPSAMILSPKPMSSNLPQKPFNEPTMPKERMRSQGLYPNCDMFSCWLTRSGEGRQRIPF